MTSTRALVPVADADGVLEQVAGLADAGAHAPAGAALARLATVLDLAEAKTVSRAEGRGVIIADGADGSALAARWFAPGETTTVHDHGTWGVAAIAEGSIRYERWTRVDGRVRLARVSRCVVGAGTTWGPPPDDVHRQTAGPDGALELILLGDVPATEPRELEEAAGVLEQGVSALSTYDLRGLADHFRDDVLFDANVPLWRFQLQGPGAFLEMAQEEFADVGELTVTELRASYADDVAAVEVAVGHGSGDQARHWREVHLLRRKDEQIVEHTIYCTGVWDAETTARQAAEAPMVRP